MTRGVLGIISYLAFQAIATGTTSTSIHFNSSYVLSLLRFSAHCFLSNSIRLITQAIQVTTQAIQVIMMLANFLLMIGMVGFRFDIR
jgi:hypothetical protein